MGGLLTWRVVRCVWPVRFTHDAFGCVLLHQPARKKSRWFERVLRCDDTAFPPSYMPHPATTEAS